MRRLAIIIAILVIIPLIELAVLIAIGQVIGVWPTILLVLATSALGGWLLRREGGRAWRAFQADLSERRPPGNNATEGLLVLVGGTFMLVPGFVSDVIGLFFLLPPTRKISRALFLNHVVNRMSPAAATSLFGPRKVRVHHGQPRHDDAPRRPGTGGGEAIEGELLD